MLHEHVLMVDINVDSWRNLQALFLESARAKRRIIVIHEDGEIVKFVHTQRIEIERPAVRVDIPHTFAEKVYEANEDVVDFVAVFDRRAFDEYFSRVQDSWDPDEDLDSYVHRTYATLDEYPDGMVTYPERARTTLGLQWRVGSSYTAVHAAVERYVVPDSTVLVGVTDAAAVWATLVVGFDADKRIKLITTVDPDDLETTDNRDGAIRSARAWVDERYPDLSLALFFDREGIQELTASTDKLAKLRELLQAGRLTVDPAPEPLSAAIRG